jgi:hypothetical protein
MIKNRTVILSLALFAIFAAACGINSVSRAQLEAVKPGDVLVYRYQKGDKSWFYADKITKIEGDTVYYNPSRSEATSGKDQSLQNNFDRDRELSIKKADLLKYESEQGDDRKVIIWINP